MTRRAARAILLAASLLLSFAAVHLLMAQEQKLNKFDRDTTKEMLRVMEGDIKKNYYDPKFHGLDLDARFREAEQKIDNATSMNYALADIAGALDALNDSHTFFFPPSRPYSHSYGWQITAVGDDKCFITAVRPGSDAEKKGVKVGDQVVQINGHDAVRDDLWKMEYVYDVLRPQTALRVVLRSPDGNTRQVDVQSKMVPKKRVVESLDDIFQIVRDSENAEWLSRSRYVEVGKGVLIWKLPDFEFSLEHADTMLGKIRSSEALILDLRGNPGGIVEVLERILGGMFEHDVKVADRIGRKPLKPEVAKTHGKAFTGQLIVLIDSGSASAAEIFARVIQLEKRGVILGDRSSGSVMEARGYGHQFGTETVITYGASITEADMIMADGKSLEHVGVTPDQRILPTAQDLAAGRDPALARAAELAGIHMTPEQAGKLFPPEWMPD